MKTVTYKGIRHNILNDAPFIGAILIANSCHKGCPGCFNEHLKKDENQLRQTSNQIIDEVIKNRLNEGIIFSGLEWSEQPEDLVELVFMAIKQHLKVMIYTHHDESTFFELLPELVHQPIYVKFGAYLPEKVSDHHFSHGVQLATTNQYIKYFG